MTVSNTACALPSTPAAWQETQILAALMHWPATSGEMGNLSAALLLAGSSGFSSLLVSLPATIALLAIYSAHLDPGDQAGTDQHSRQQRCFAPGTFELKVRPGSSEPLPVLLCYRTGLCLSPALPFSANLLHSKLLFCSQLLCERATLTFLLFPLPA